MLDAYMFYVNSTRDRVNRQQILNFPSHDLSLEIRSSLDLDLFRIERVTPKAAFEENIASKEIKKKNRREWRRKFRDL